jgi:hypothetical protein
VPNLPSYRRTTSIISSLKRCAGMVTVTDIGTTITGIGAGIEAGIEAGGTVGITVTGVAATGIAATGDLTEGALPLLWLC